MDFNNLEIGENLAETNRQAEMDADIAKLNADARILMKSKYGVPLINTLQAPRVAVNPVTQEEYNCRLYALLNIIRNPELANDRYPLATSWKTMYPNIEYNDKATNWKFSKKDKDTVIEIMKELAVYRRFKFEGVSSVVTIMKDVHKTQVIEQQAQIIADQDERIKQYQFLMDGTEDRIIYKGHVMPYSAKHRGYHITLSGKKHVISQANITKLQAVFDFIDMFEG